LNRNQKLSHVLGGRRIESFSIAASELTITFADKSTVNAPLAAGTLADIPTKTIAVVHQDGPHLQISFDDQTATDIALNPESSSVLVRSASGTVEYVGQPHRDAFRAR
jgi:hypothetical protein